MPLQATWFEWIYEKEDLSKVLVVEVSFDTVCAIPPGGVSLSDGKPWRWQERKLHGRKTTRQVAARGHTRGCDGRSGRVFVAYFADGSIGKNDAPGRRK